MKKVLSIAGSDCSGGAGIQADLKTFSAHGVFGMSVIVSVVAENTSRVIDIQDITPDMIEKQIDAVFEDIEVDAVKIGMLSTPVCMKAVAKKLLQYKPQNVVINLVNTTITNFLSRRQEIGMLQAIGLSKKQLIKMLCYEGLMYSVFATLVTLVLGTGLGFLSVQVVVKTMNPYFYYSFPWMIVLIYLAILLIVQFTLISYTTGNLKKQSLVEQIRTME